MRACIEIDVPDAFLAERVAEIKRDHPRGLKLTPRKYLEDRLGNVADDELLIALWGWPIEARVIVHGAEE